MNTRSKRLRAYLGASAIGIAALMATAAAADDAAAPSGPATVHDGVYTEAQADRGIAAFAEQGCVACHGDNMGGGPMGPTLFGGRFMFKWADKSVEDFYTWVHDNMPPGGGGAASDAEYLDIVAAVLRANSFPAGETELEATTIGSILITRP